MRPSPLPLPSTLTMRNPPVPTGGYEGTAGAVPGQSASRRPPPAGRGREQAGALAPVVEAEGGELRRLHLLRVRPDDRPAGGQEPEGRLEPLVTEAAGEEVGEDE